MNVKAIAIILLFAVRINVVQAQEIPVHVKYTQIYALMDELANQQIIDLNTAVKPYSRKLIAEKLLEAHGQTDKLNRRQRWEVDFYLRDYGKELGFADSLPKRLDLFYYEDDLFRLTVNPILGGDYAMNENGTSTHWWNGAKAEATIGQWAFWASLRDNHEKPILKRPGELSDHTAGANIKGGTDYSEMMGGVSWQWEWGSIAATKDHLSWGTNYHGANIFSPITPTFFQLKLHIQPTEWFDFHYVHGQLISKEVDSTRSYYVTTSYGTDYREVYHKKYIAANIFTFSPMKQLKVSVGNSIVYADLDMHPAYLMPLFFYKSVDHSTNDGIDNMNSQMFADVSMRLIKNVHLYGTLFIDELSVDRFFDPGEYNFYSYKAGMRTQHLPVENLGFTVEYTHTMPLVFKHYVPTLTFETNHYNLGHYLTDNAEEFHVALDYKPWRTLYLKTSFTLARRGKDHTELGGARVGNPFMDTEEWRSESFRLEAQYQPLHDVFVRLSYESRNVTGRQDWITDYYYGKTGTLSLGLHINY